MRLTRPLMLMIVLIAVSCGQTRPGSSVTGGSQGTELTASCGGAVFDQLPLDTSAFVPFTTIDELDLSRVGGEAPYFRKFSSGYEWFVTQEGEGWRQLFGRAAEPDADQPNASMRIELGEGGWAPVGWGGCQIELDAEGWGNARFVVDPRNEPDPGANQVSLLATEVACAGGQAPGDRAVKQVILDENERVVSLVILVEPTKGATTCQGNPAFPVEVQLDSPLGDREILDASVYPPKRRWP
jgi:hypothetical protein